MTFVFLILLTEILVVCAGVAIWSDNIRNSVVYIILALMAGFVAGIAGAPL